MSFFEKLRLLPVFILIASLSFGVRLADVVTGVSQAPGSAFAETSDSMMKPSDSMLSSVESDAGSQDDKMEVEEVSEKEAESDWRDATDADIEFSPMQAELFEDLVARRRELDVRDREVTMREALLQAAQQEIDVKLGELNALRDEIQDLLKQQSEEEEARIASLVKIYEGMKAKDAARIFNTLDMDILLQVVSRMSERKSAPVIAAMSAERARSLTIMLAEQKKLEAMSQPLIER